ncbi:MAG: hypothetical protein AAGJ82_13050 [Bacteroidota bacterium]
MKVLNIHQRTIDQPIEKVAALFKTLATENDNIWPWEKWPKMKFSTGIKIGAQGGHGPIRYAVEQYDPAKIIQFRFSKPTGFTGTHAFELEQITSGQTQIKHTIRMNTSGKSTLLWVFGIRSLHDALMEDGLDKLENNFLAVKKKTEWNFWVKFLRKQLAKNSK